jgi:hypothetical protein
MQYASCDARSGITSPEEPGCNHRGSASKSHQAGRWAWTHTTTVEEHGRAPIQEVLSIRPARQLHREPRVGGCVDDPLKAPGGRAVDQAGGLTRSSTSSPPFCGRELRRNSSGEMPAVQSVNRRRQVTRRRAGDRRNRPGPAHGRIGSPAVSNRAVVIPPGGGVRGFF